ncbi:alanine racemase [Psychrobacter sp. 1Y11]|uniref:alanine racemase n=1 Tax=Psychrobacter sp. 1Y11 TaxID=3457446 RepID=UPI003FD4A408
MRTATVIIDPQALTHNLMQVKRLAPKSKVLAMVKANAYGHGVAMVLPALQQADGIGVASFTEAFEARQLGWEKSIGLVEGVFSADEWQQAIDYECSCVIHHQPQLDWALANVPSPDSATRSVWLKYNTGMNRLGFDDQQTITAAKQLHQAGYQLILTTHFANADDREHPLNDLQIQRFDKMLALLKSTVSEDIQGSLCNSAGLVNFPDRHYDWVRPGIMLYGSSPVIDKSASELELQPAMEFSARIMALSTVNTGEAIGYGSRWIADKPTRTALVSIGYGDGYPRVVNDETHVCVLVKDKSVGSEQNCQSYQSYQDYKSYLCPVRGRVAMDMIVIDVSSVPNNIALDSKVILWGNAPHVDDIAAQAGTIGYELLCRLSARPARKQAL